MGVDFAPMTMGSGRAAFTIRGDSMAPLFKSRDLLLVDTTVTNPTRGGAFLCWYEERGDYAVRTVEALRSGKLALSCANPKYSGETVDAAEVEIAGKVCGVWRDSGL